MLESTTIMNQKVEKWWPQYCVNILGMQDIEVVLLEDNFKKVIRDVTNSKDIGLSVVKTKEYELLAICLTTKDKIYVLRPHYKPHLNLFNDFLKETKLKILIPDGTKVADILYRSCKVTLMKQIDLSAMHVQMSIRHLNRANLGQNSMFSITHIQENIKPKIRKFKDLISYWLHLEVDLKLTEEEIEAVKLSPLNELAKNGIKKRACLVRALGMEMVNQFEKFKFQESYSLYSLAVRAPDDLREDFERRDTQVYGDLIECLNKCPARIVNNLD